MRRRRLIQLMLILLPLVLIGTVTAQPIVGTETFIFDVRADMELLADQVFGEGTRPEGWTGDAAPNSPSALGDLWYDNELLADEVFGDVRPDSWAGATVASATIISRNVRHDLELTADEVYGVGERPDSWRGAAAIIRCDRTLQNNLEMLARFYRILSQTPESALNFCQAVASEIEDELINIIFGTENADGVLPDPITGLGAVRGDMERLSDELLGLNTRPEGYTGNRDVESPTLIGDLFLDMALLADDQLGDNVRPPSWIGVVTNSPAISFLNLRHDLELLADATLGVNVRPNGWQGVNPIERCDPFVNSLVFLITQNYEVTFTEIDPAAADYCNQISLAANALVENPPVLDVVEQEQRLTGSSNFAFAYLDVAALDYMGIMPGGTRFRAVYRNFGDSEMMFVAGQDFALYVDRRFTTVEETTFNGLPTVENVDPIAFCDAVWCNGPGPTPTPTGFGPLMQVLIQTTPQATPNAAELETTKQLVSWNYIRVTYVQDNVQARTAQVALEICAQPAQNATACEPVLSVFDQQTNTNKPVISTYNGLNVYEFRYGYTTNVVIEGETRFSNDVWISDPTIR